MKGEGEVLHTAVTAGGSDPESTRSSELELLSHEETTAIKTHWDRLRSPGEVASEQAATQGCPREAPPPTPFTRHKQDKECREMYILSIPVHFVVCPWAQN